MIRTVEDLAADLCVDADAVVPFGPGVAKIVAPPPVASAGRLILVSAMSPTPHGEGKTTTSIGLADAMRLMGERVCLTLREPSLGPVFGRKGGGTGGGRAQLVPTDRINLHFTGDLHAVGAAHNLIAATIDNALHFDTIDADATSIGWPRVVDMNDRALRHIIVGLGGRLQAPARETSFAITAASELMAILCLATDEDDLRARVDAIIVGARKDGSPLRVADLNVTGSVLALLRDAMMPNLVQTEEGTPALVHGGPFANIAHGCSSIIADRLALAGVDYVVTEAGFGFDLGGEKFYDLKAPILGLAPAAVVVVATIRALYHHGHGQLVRGLDNLAAHLDGVARVRGRPVVAINRMDEDADADVTVVRDFCAERGVPVATCDHFRLGGRGAAELASLVVGVASDAPLERFYAPEADIPDKLDRIVRDVYGGRGTSLEPAARKTFERLQSWGLGCLPVCVAKTPASFSDDPHRLGRPRDFLVTVRDFELAAGAGFAVALCGAVERMPGLPRLPNAAAIDLVDGTIRGLV